MEDKKLGRTTGHVRGWNGLYYFGLNQHVMSHSLMIESSIHNQENFQLYHCRLGHQSFHVIIKLLFPSLFKD